nr:DUF4258 domain-containing protein [Rhodocyclus tenuis]
MQLSETDILRGVRALVGRGRVRFTVHAEERMAERGFDQGQVKECLCKGFFVEPPVIPNRAGPIEYKFNIQAQVDSQTMQVVATLRPEQNIIVITVIDAD